MCGVKAAHWHGSSKSRENAHSEQRLRMQKKLARCVDIALSQASRLRINELIELACICHEAGSGCEAFIPLPASDFKQTTSCCCISWSKKHLSWDFGELSWASQKGLPGCSEIPNTVEEMFSLSVLGALEKQQNPQTAALAGKDAARSLGCLPGLVRRAPRLGALQGRFLKLHRRLRERQDGIAGQQLRLRILGHAWVHDRTVLVSLNVRSEALLHRPLNLHAAIAKLLLGSRGDLV